MTNDKDSAVLAERVERVTKWLDGGCSTWGTPMQDIREILNALRQPTQSDAQIIANERKAIAAWLRGGLTDFHADAEYSLITNLADAIERGAYLQEQSK
jgi:hypothetical protein